MNCSVEDSWGVGSFRQCAGFPIPKENVYCAPLGNCIVQWNVKTKARSIFQAHQDLITVLLRNIDGIILSASVGGEIKIWSENFSVLLASFVSSTDNIIYGVWSTDGKMFSLCSKGLNQMIITYNLATIFDCWKLKTAVRPAWFFEAPQTVSTTEQGKRDSYDCFNASVFKENGEIIAIYQSSSKCEIYLFSCEGSCSQTANISPLGDEKNVMLCISNEIKNNLICVGLQHGVFGFYDADTLGMTAVVQATSSPQVCIWKDDMLVTISYLSGVMSFWSKNGEMLREISGFPTGSIVHMNLAATENTFWIAGIMSLHYVTISNELSKVISHEDVSFLSLTGCGIAVSNDEIVASGDFTGRVLLWKNGQVLPIEELLLPSPAIRSLLWLKNYLLIGLLDGELYAWSYQVDSRSQIRSAEIVTINDCDLVNHLIGGVVAMKTNNSLTKLAAGTTAGYLYVFSISFHCDGQLKLELLFSSLQHKPKVQPSGNELNMEIWSLEWSVNDDVIATTSEDQTCAIALSSTGDIQHILTGHTTAVTSVDWKLLSTGENVLTTCADDRTVRVYDGVTFSLLHILNTYDIYGWHTLTYLRIRSKDNLLVCSTQNGYLVAWNLKTYACIFKRKLHGGSIEGLVLDKPEDYVFTVGSDCVVNRFNIE